MSGKGSTPRPREVSREEYERRWAETFGGPNRPSAQEWREMYRRCREAGAIGFTAGALRALREEDTARIVGELLDGMKRQAPPLFQREDTDGTRSDHVQG